MLRAALLFVLSLWSPAYGGTIAVIYPETFEPYSVFIDEIIKGIKTRSKDNVRSFPLKPDDTVKIFKDWANSVGDIRAIVALGNKAQMLLKSTKWKIPLYFGGSYLPPSKRENGISLFTDPDIFLDQLASLSPNTNTVFVLARKNAPKHIFRLLHKAAESHKLQIQIFSVSNTEDIAKALHDIENSANATDAVWFYHGVIPINKDIILPAAIKLSWNKQLIVFSDKAQYTNRGMLFCLFPDYKGLGYTLADMVNHNKKGILLLTDTFKAVNKRTAQHLNIELSAEDKEHYNLIFPLNSYDN